MPDFLPDRLEAGTHNIPGVSGLLVGLRYVEARGERSILRHEKYLTALTARGLSRIPNLKIYAAEEMSSQAGVLSFTVEGRDCEEVGEALAAAGVAVRSGLHCAPLAHRSAGTLETGTVRASFSTFNTETELAVFLRAMDRIARN